MEILMLCALGGAAVVGSVTLITVTALVVTAGAGAEEEGERCPALRYRSHGERCHFTENHHGPHRSGPWFDRPYWT